MGAFRPVTFSSRERKGLTAANHKKLQKAIIKHIETHPQIKKILRKKTSGLLKRLKKTA
jgi:hypothetical protein